MSADNVISTGQGLPDAQKLPAPMASRAILLAGVMAVVGIILCVVAGLGNPQRLAFGYLTGFAFTATLGAGAVFFVILQHLVKAGWSVAARRQLEWMAAATPVLLVLFIPVLLWASTTHAAWWAGPEALHDELLTKKTWWLNQFGFTWRGIVYILVWAATGWYFASQSAKQDVSGDPGITARLQKLSAPLMLLFALSISGAGFDWLMSLQPKWYSTIFGVYTFAGGFLAALACLALMTIRLQGTGLYKRVSTVEHRHDIGKLMFAFTVFWAYIAFSQFMLIFYANIPEETIFYWVRWYGDSHTKTTGWASVSTLLVIGHFAFPFVFLLSRHVKRHPVGFTVAAIVLLLMHYVDMYWIVMPILDVDGPRFGLAELGGLLAPAGVFFLVTALQAKKTALYPVKDPRLPETLRVENF